MGIDWHLEAQVAQRRQRRESPRHGSQVRPRARHLRGCSSGFTVKDVCSSQSRHDKTSSEEWEASFQQASVEWRNTMDNCDSGFWDGGMQGCA